MENNIREFEQYLADLNKYNVPNILENTRERSIVEHRQLFHTILRKKYNKSLKSIADFMTYKGKKTELSIVIHSVNRTLETNYYNSENVAKIYDGYFEDKREERIAKMSNKVSYASKDSKLQDLMRDIPVDKEGEIYELVLLRVKSWAWKNKDNCKLIEGL